MRIGEYRLEQPIGEGGMGAVWRAVHTRLEKPVALKLLSRRMSNQPDAVARFAREMKAVGRLTHPNIVGAMDAGEWNGVPFLVMEFIDGIDLGRLVKRRGPLGLADACEVARNTALGVHDAHEHGMVHRDIKPGNIMLASDGTVKLLDLGLARLSDDAGESPSSGHDASTTCATAELTDTNMLVGTSAFMAPEQRQDPRAVDARADVFALGRTLVFLLTGAADGPVANKVPSGLSRVLQRLLAEQPEDRFPSAAAVAAALRPWCRGHDLVALVGAKSIARKRKHHVLMAIVAVAIIAIGVGIGLSLLRNNDDPTSGTVAGPGPDPEPPPVAIKDPPKTGQLGMTQAEAEDLQKLWAAYLDVDVTTTNSIGMKLTLIPPGELNLSVNARARITRPYRIGTTEVTMGQFRKFVDAKGYRTEVENKRSGQYVYKIPNPKNEEILVSRGKRDPKYSWLNPGYAGATDDYPVTQISWNDAVAFCEWLSEIDGKKYRLPTFTEQQWAARAGERGRYPGSEAERENYASLEKYAWTFVNSRDRPQPVARLRPNAWGLLDVLGNADEWSYDWNWMGTAPTGLHLDYQGPPTGTIRMLYGGGYNGRSTFEGYFAKKPDEGISEAGFRVLREP
jgi:formylglycine-generating enzyme required for sulfatase activity/tRNA A-37 threonylcarbamoyl transferase component Bud32